MLILALYPNLLNVSLNEKKVRNLEFIAFYVYYLHNEGGVCSLSIVKLTYYEN